MYTVYSAGSGLMIFSMPALVLRDCVACHCLRRNATQQRRSAKSRLDIRIAVANVGLFLRDAEAGFLPLVDASRNFLKVGMRLSAASRLR